MDSTAKRVAGRTKKAGIKYPHHLGFVHAAYLPEGVD
jgi:hypothetical protein